MSPDPTSDSPYVRARGIGEGLVKEAFPGATILRPSVIFCPEDAFFNRLAALAVTPVLPLFGSGETKLQPASLDLGGGKPNSRRKPSRRRSATCANLPIWSKAQQGAIDTMSGRISQSLDEIKQTALKMKEPSTTKKQATAQAATTTA